jgi:hypothetical protein
MRRFPASARPIANRLSDERGFTMLIAIGTLLVTTLLTVAVFTAVQGDIGSSRHDLDGKLAYYAADSGVNDYLKRHAKRHRRPGSDDDQRAVFVPVRARQRVDDVQPE